MVILAVQQISAEGLEGRKLVHWPYVGRRLGGLCGGMAPFPLPTVLRSLMRDSPRPGLCPSELDKGKGSKNIPRRTEGFRSKEPGAGMLKWASKQLGYYLNRHRLGN